jgi:hypothetical protein
VVMGHGPNASFTIQLDSFIALVDSGSGKVGEEQPVFSRSLSATGDFGGGENNRSSHRRDHRSPLPPMAFLASDVRGTDGSLPGDVE